MSLTSFQPKAKIGILLFILVAGFAATGYFGKDIVLHYFAKATSCPVKDLKIENVASRSADISFTTDEAIQSRVEYGTSSDSLTFSIPETSASTNHKLTIPSLASDKDYYFAVSVGTPGKLPGTTDNLRCDSLGATCTSDSCKPWQFKTEKTEQIITPTTTKSATKSATPSGKIEPTSTMSAFCQKVRNYIGKTSKDASWSANIKQYDIDANGVINGLDIIKCPKTGK